MSRIFRVLQLIQGGGRWNVAEIAKEISASERTIHRDLNVLELLGVPYYYDKELSGYVVRPGWQFPTLPVSPDEALGLAISTTLSQAAGLDVATGNRDAARKMAARSSTETKDILRDAEHLIGVLDLKLADHSQHREIIKTLQWALINRHQVTGQYSSPYQEKAVKLSLHPIRMCLIRQAWYLIARPTDETEPCTYRIARFKSLRSVDQVAEIPDEFDLKEYFGNAWGVFRGSPTYHVQIEFTKDAAPLVTETKWHTTQQIKRHRDGRVMLSFTVDGLAEIVWWILGWSGRAKVIEPTELRNLVVEKLQAALQLNTTE
jgi:predicted DNA-binding transcriptional regulator YafY